jgi:hypothetical protein
VRLQYRSYFSVYALQRFYLPSPIHSKYINLEVLQRYLPVGGVRIEDDLLITPKGYENLTTAPKGDAMLDIIRQGESSGLPFATRRQLVRAKISKEQPALLRAPGISTDKPASILKPIARATTMPVEFKQRKSVDFEPFEGSSLFSNFKRSQTTDERIQQWQQDRDLAIRSRNQSHARSQCASVCGDSSKGVKHVYLTTEFQRPATPYQGSFEQPLPPCKKCTILCETLDRLRQNLSLSEQSSPKPESQPQSMAKNHEQYREDVRSKSVASGQRTQPSSTDLTSAQRKERAARIDVIRDMQQSPEPISRHDEIALMQRLVLDNRQASLRKHQSVPGLGLQKLEDDFLHATSGQTSRLQKADMDIASNGPIQARSSSESNLEAAICLAETAAIQERRATHEHSQLRRQADNTYHRARQATESIPRSSRPLDQATRDRQTLYNTMIQAQKNPLLQSERCCIGAEQRGQSLISAAMNKSHADSTTPGLGK